MTDPRPEPKYGQYAPVPPAVAPQPAEAPPTSAQPTDAPPAPATVVRRSPPGDVMLTTVLLLVGVLDVVGGFRQFADLGGALRQAYSLQGWPEFTSDALANAFGAGINVARVVLLLVVIVASLLRIRIGRRAFWVPLVGGAVSAIIVVTCMLVVILGDPAFGQYVSTQSTGG